VVVDNLALGQAYREVVKVISVSILYFNLGAGDDYVYYGTTEFYGLHTHQPLRVRGRQALEPHLVSSQVFPEYYLINVERFEDLIESDLDEWVYLLKHSTVRSDFQAKHIDKAREKLTLLKMTTEERRRYERYLMNVVIERDVIDTAKAEGVAEGLAKGREEGREQAQRELLQKLQQSGLSLEQLSKLTGLGEVELKQLLAGVAALTPSEEN